MKKILILFCLSLLTIQLVKSQKSDKSISTSPIGLHDLYMKKHKTNNTVGWIMLGSGIGMTLGGFATNVSTGWGEGNKNNGLWLSYLGGATTLASIPFFISAGSNKRKAKLALKGESVTIRNKLLVKSNYPAIALIIQL
jgi:hypothetical protein